MTMLRRLKILILPTLLYLAGCVEELNFSKYKIEGIQKEYYAGLVTDTIKPKPLPTKITIVNGDESTPVYLNGYPITEYISGNEINTSDIVDFLRQGSNQLMVAPLSFGPVLNFGFDNQGPLIDVHNVERLGAYLNVELRVDDTTDITELWLEEMNYNFEGGTDNTQYKSFKTSTQSGTGIKHFFTEQNGYWVNNSSINANKPMYKIFAKDAYGYTSELHYLAPNQKINNVFKLRINKKILDTIVPLAESKVSYMHIYSPDAMDNMGKSYPTNPDAAPSEALNIMSKFWSQDGVFYGDTGNGAKTSNQANCGYIETNKWNAINEGVYFNCTKWDGNRCNTGDWVIPSNIAYKTGECTKVIMYDTELGEASDLKFTLVDGNGKQGYIDLNIKLKKGTKPKALKANLGIKHVKCGKQSYSYGGFLGIGAKTAYETDNYCRITGNASAGLGLVSLGDLNVSADTGNPTGNVKVLIHNGNLDLDLPGMKLNLGGLKIGSGLDGIIGLISGLLDGMFVDIVKGVIKANMPQFILGADILTEWDEEHDASLQVQSHAYQVWTNADNNNSNALEWYMYYAGYLKPLKNHSGLDVHVLGSRYDIEPVLAPVVTNADIDMAININIINQALMAFYQSGISHITMTGNPHFSVINDKEQKTHFGVGITDSFTFSEGEKRIRLIPRSPGTFQMNNSTVGLTQATLYYRDARMIIETYKGSSFEENFDVEVDMKIGVVMKAQNDKFYITVLGVPELNINAIKIGGNSNYIYNNDNQTLNASFSSNAVKGIVQGLVNLFLSVTIPEISKNMFEWEYPGIPIPETSKGIFVSTKSISANGGKHLSFGLGMSEKSCVLDAPEDKYCKKD